MKRTLGLLLTGVFWIIALALAFATLYYEFAYTPRKDALYTDLTRKAADLSDPNQINQILAPAHSVWYNETALLGAVLIFAGIAYLMYVKFLQPVPDQERVISGIKGQE